MENEAFQTYDEIYEVPQGGYLAFQAVFWAATALFLWGVYFAATSLGKYASSESIVFGFLAAMCLATEYYLWRKKNRRVGLDYTGLHILMGNQSEDFIRWSDVSSLQEHYTKRLLILQDATLGTKVKISRGLKDYEKLLGKIREMCGRNLKKPELPIVLDFSPAIFLKFTLIGLFLFIGVLMIHLAIKRAGTWGPFVIVLAFIVARFLNIFNRRVFSLRVGPSEAVLRLAFKRVVLGPEDIASISVSEQRQEQSPIYFLNVNTKAGKSYRMYEDLAPISYSREIFQVFLGDRYVEGPPPRRTPFSKWG
jgi:hypothetical protein